MEQPDPRQLFSTSPGFADRPGPDCPDDQALTAALDGEYRVIERSVFEAHVSGCDDCLARLGRIARLRRDGFEAEIPEITMARAHRLFPPRPALRPAPTLAAAAMIALAAILTFLWTAPSPESPLSTSFPVPEVRNIDPDAHRPQVRFPGDGATVDLANPLFEWSAVPGILHYDVRIVSADGTVIWQERVDEPQWRLPGHLRLAAGEDYYFRVDAYLTQAKRVGSRHVLFRIRSDD